MGKVGASGPKATTPVLGLDRPVWGTADSWFRESRLPTRASPRLPILPTSYQSPLLKDKCLVSPASRTPIHHHLICIKMRSPLIGKTNKNAASIMAQQQAGS